MADETHLPMKPTDQEAMRKVEHRIWAEESGPCPVCAHVFTAENLVSRDPRVASVLPRQLVCGPCWPTFAKGKK